MKKADIINLLYGMNFDWEFPIGSQLVDKILEAAREAEVTWNLHGGNPQVFIAIGNHGWYTTDDPGFAWLIVTRDNVERKT